MSQLSPKAQTLTSKNLNKLINYDIPECNELGLCEHFGIPYIDKPVFINQMLQVVKKKPIPKLENNFKRLKVYEQITDDRETDDLLEEKPWKFNDPKESHLSVNIPTVYKQELIATIEKHIRAAYMNAM
jgi:hypothetical protein